MNKIKRFKKQLDSLHTILDYNRVDNELDLINKNRLSNILDLKFNPKYLNRILKAELKNQSNRSRVSEILIQLSSLCNKYSSILSLLQDYLFVNFQLIDDISEYRSIDAKRSRIRSYLEKYIRFLDDYNSLVEKAELIIADLDKAHFSITHTSSVVVKILENDKMKM